MKKTVSRLLKYTVGYKKYFALCLLSALISVTATLAAPKFVAAAIDEMYGAGRVNFEGIFKILICIAAAAAVSALGSRLTARSTNIIAYNTSKKLRSDIFGKLGKVPVSFIDSSPHGDLVNRTVNDIDQISDGLLQGFTQLFTGLTTIIGTLAFMLFTDLITAAVVIILTPLSILTASVIARLTHRMFMEQSITQGKLTAFVNEMVGNQKLVKAFGHESENEKSFFLLNKKLYKCGVDAQFYSSLTNPSTRFVNNLVYAAVGIVGAMRVIFGGLTIGGVSCFLSYANQYTKPFNEISGVLTQLQSAIASAERVFELLDAPEEPSDSLNAVRKNSIEGNVTLENVSFSYVAEKPLLKNISVEVKKGQKIAVVGPTGCGKTTLINLLLRFYDVNEGRILLDGTDIREMKRSDVLGAYTMVLQETWLQSGTIKENIAYGKPNATDEEIISAGKAAYAHSFIMRMPNGYDTVIGSDGGALSQGQKQLLCAARAMLSDAPILILDEATSNIDTRTEIKVQQAFEKLSSGRTSFIVAHRLSTIKEADLILVMKDGNIIEQGTHDELLSSDTFYKELFESQFK